jgi:CRISPR-associated endonuclease/helicase Cas3
LSYKKYMGLLENNAENSKLCDIRKSIKKSCLSSGSGNKGIYSLTVPTGGGKTLASMGFSLKHASRNGCKRIIYAIPFTSIIEQNAEVFRKALGDKAVLEHHSNIDYDRYESTEREIYKLASENWDAPVIVTTNVQFFESLFSNKPSHCRKLHNLANSIIVLDEVQTIPDEYLKPCLLALQCLVRDYGATIVLCTATQPALDFAWPDKNSVTEIISEPAALFADLRRVEIIKLVQIDNDYLAGNLLENKQVLYIVNTKRRALQIYESIRSSSDTYHLSTYMCPIHRSETLNRIRDALRNNKPCTVISTQLIEAGVDIDFPVVFRDIAGIDSIAQAAGRCNREGKLDKGLVYIVRPEEALPIGLFQRQAELGEAICRQFEDILAPDAVNSYFRKRYRDSGPEGLDKKEIIDSLNVGINELDFPCDKIRKEFNFIKTKTESIIVPYDSKCKKLLDVYEKQYGLNINMSYFQRYVVNLYPNEIEELRSKGYLNERILACPVLDINDTDFSNGYSSETGIRINKEMETLSL